MSYRIVAAESQLIPALAVIETLAAQTFPPTDLPEPLRSTPTDEAVFHQAQRRGDLWVVLQKAQIPVGFLLAERLDDSFHIKEMDIDPRHARRGLGGKLLQHAIKIAEKRQYKKITLTTFKHLPWNAPFYQKFGFTTIDPADTGPSLAALLRQEQTVGLSNRVAMVLLIAAEW